MKILFINTPWRAKAHRWELNEDGLVTYRDELVEPKFVYENFEIDYPMFKMIRVDICEKIIDEESKRGFRWIEIERFL